MKLDNARTAARYVQRWRDLHGRYGGVVSRVKLHVEFAKRDAAFKWPLYGNTLTLLREGRMELGRDVLLSEHTSLMAFPGGRINIGERTFFNRNVAVTALHRVDIGFGCAFGPGCFITDHEHTGSGDGEYGDPGDLVTRGPVVIEDKVWCGANVVITSGVTIGHHSIIGANAVVTHDIPPHSVAAGVPARVVKEAGQPAHVFS